MTAPLVVCMTHGRAGRVKTLGVLPHVVLCVAESQEPLYREHYPDALYLVHPDEVVGISPKRRWLMAEVGDDHDVFMVDDDCVAVLDLGAGPGSSGRIEDEQTILDIIERAFGMAEAIGSYVVSFSPWNDPLLYRPMVPFALTGFASGHCLGIRRGSKLWFPDVPSLVNDDQFISGLNAFEHRFMLQDLRYAFSCPQAWVNPGGMSHLRTMDVMKRNAEMLKDYFGDAIVLKTGTARAGLTHSFQVALKVPW